MVNLTPIFLGITVVVFVIVVWNLVLPLASSQNYDFVQYVKDRVENEKNLQDYVQKPITSAVASLLHALPASQQNLAKSLMVDRYQLGPRELAGDINDPHYALLTFYVQYGNDDNVHQLVELLSKYHIPKAIFFIEPAYMSEHPFVVRLITDHGYSVKPWTNIPNYDKAYTPSTFQGVVLADKEILARAQKDNIAIPFLNVALHYNKQNVIAFTPKIMSKHSALLEEMLKHNGKSIIFTDGAYGSNDDDADVVNSTAAPSGSVAYSPSKSPGLSSYDKDSTTTSSASVTENDSKNSSVTTNILRLNSSMIGNNDRPNNSGETITRSNVAIISIKQLANKFPSAISTFEGQPDSFLVKTPILVDRGVTLNVENTHLFLESSNSSSIEQSPSSLSSQSGDTANAAKKNNENPKSYVIVKGSMPIRNSTVSSFDPSIAGPDPNGYHPRPYIIARDGGKLDIYNSTITYLGYSLGGITDTRFARAAVAYYNTSNFSITDSDLSSNYYGMYSALASNFNVTNNDVHHNIKYGLDPHSGSKDFIVDSNYVHDNGNQGIICSLQCENVTITNNVVENNVEGIGLHWLTNSSVVKDNIVRFNQKYGVFIQKISFDNLVENNIIVGNKFGVGLLEGSANNIVKNNTIAYNTNSDFVEENKGSIPNDVNSNNFGFMDSTIKFAFQCDEANQIGCDKGPAQPD